MFFFARLFPRSNHYAPLDVDIDLDGKPIPRRHSPRHLLVALLVAVLFLVGIILLTVTIVRRSMALPPRPLDDFQHLYVHLNFCSSTCLDL